MDGVDLVDVVAEPVEKLVSRKSAKAALRAHVGKPLVEFTRDIGHGCEARAALGDVDGPVLRSEERRVGKECFSKLRSWWLPAPYKTKTVSNTHTHNSIHQTNRIN